MRERQKVTINFDPEISDRGFVSDFGDETVSRHGLTFPEVKTPSASGCEPRT